MDDVIHSAFNIINSSCTFLEFEKFIILSLLQLEQAMLQYINKGLIIALASRIFVLSAFNDNLLVFAHSSTLDTSFDNFFSRSEIC